MSEKEEEEEEEYDDELTIRSIDKQQGHESKTSSV